MAPRQIFGHKYQEAPHQPAPVPLRRPVELEPPRESLPIRMTEARDTLALLHRIEEDAASLADHARRICQEELEEQLLEYEGEHEEIGTERWAAAADAMSVVTAVITTAQDTRQTTFALLSQFDTAREQLDTIANSWDDVVGALRNAYIKKLTEDPTDLKSYQTRASGLKTVNEYVSSMFETTENPLTPNERVQLNTVIHRSFDALDKVALPEAHDEWQDMYNRSNRAQMMLNQCEDSRGRCKLLLTQTHRDYARIRTCAEELGIDLNQ